MKKNAPKLEKKWEKFKYLNVVTEDGIASLSTK